MAEPTSSGPGQQASGPAFEVQVKALEGMLKEGHVRQFTVMSDEGERVGGTDSAPSPLGYFTLGIGF